MSENKFIGRWKIVAWEEVKPDGEVRPFRPRPLGYLYYTPDGFMSATVTSADRPKLGMTLQEIAQRPVFSLRFWKAMLNYFRAATEYFSYTGTYEIVGNKVIHHVETDPMPDAIGRDRVREFEFVDDNRVVLWVKDVPDHTQKLTWQRV